MTGDHEPHVYSFILRGHDPVPEPDMVAWAGWMLTADRQVGLTEIPISGKGSLMVSTVFIGTNQAFAGGQPILFETLVDGPDNVTRERRQYCTWDEAAAGHASAVAWALLSSVP